MVIMIYFYILLYDDVGLFIRITLSIKKRVQNSFIIFDFPLHSCLLFSLTPFNGFDIHFLIKVYETKKDYKTEKKLKFQLSALC